VEPAPADLRLGQRAGAGLRRAAVRGRRRCWAPWRTALVAALGLALSSTAIALQVMGERNLLPTSSGQAGFSILLFQDVAAIPILALLPLLGVADARQAEHGAALAAGRQDRRRHRRHHPGRPAAAAAAAALDRQEPHAGDLHRGRAAAGGGHRGADAAGGPVDGAGRLPGRRAAGRERIPARTGNRHRAVQGPAARPVLHGGRHEHRLRRADALAGHDGG
jgi:hypothetical protein